MEARPPNMEVSTIKVKSPEKKKKQKSDDKEAVRKRRKRLRDSPDFQAVLAEELEKASGGGECKECTGYLVELGGVYKQNADLTRDYSLRMLEYMGARKDYESRIVDMQDCITTLEGSVKQQKEIEKAKDRIILALRQKIAMKHGRKYTGRKRGRPKKLVDADGAPIVAKRPAGSEEEEEEGGE